MIWLRSVFYVVYLYAGMGAIGISAMPASMLDAKASLVASRVWARYAVFGLRWICGLHLRFEGLEHVPKGAALVACKHQSMLETIAIFLALPEPAIVFKRELRNMPVFGWFVQRTGMIMVDREAHAKALKDMVRAARQSFEAGRPIFIFPEGTRQAPGAAPDYKPGVAAIYRELEAPCIPVALNTGLFCHGLLRKPGRAVIRFLPPIPAGLPRREFMRQLEERIEAGCADLAGEAGP